MEDSITKIKDNYKSIISDTKQILKKTQNSIYHIGTIRLILFVIGIIGIIYFWSAGWIIICGIFAITFIPFLLLLKYHNRLFYKKDYLEKKIEINKHEIQAIDYDISSFDGGKEFIDPTNLYTYDLDIFGENSLFQNINRTSTEMGKKHLANWLNTHLINKNDIQNRQKSINELTPELNFRQEFRIRGLLYKGKMADEEEIKNWSESKSYYRNIFLLRILPYVVLSVNIVLFVLAALNIVSFSTFGVSFMSAVIISFAFTKNITSIQSMYGKKMQILSTYAQLLQLIEEKEVNNITLKEIKALLGNDSKTASRSINELSSLMHALDQRNNMLMALILNGLMLWELRQMMKIEAWREKYADSLPQWLEAIGRMDAYCSLSTFAYNNPDYIFPEISEKSFSFQASKLGHPLMNREKCVKNDINIEKRPYFIIVTGANMAGKSTYLRTVGINYLLACIGAPVVAEKMTIYPARLITSLRTTDSLTDNESYFFAELKRLKLIIDMLQRGEELFIILDEILKGTNSIDKQKGSLALIKQFMLLNTNGIIATHDLLLGTLAELYPNNIRNYRFEADIKNDELTFSYELREGIAQNMNACFLMKKMGIAGIDE